MSRNHDIIKKLDAYSARAGIEASTVCRKATGNPRLRERLINRLDKADSDIEALQNFMNDNPVPNSTANNQRVNARDDFQGGAA